MADEIDVSPLGADLASAIRALNETGLGTVRVTARASAVPNEAGPAGAALTFEAKRVGAPNTPTVAITLTSAVVATDSDPGVPTGHVGQTLKMDTSWGGGSALTTRTLELGGEPTPVKPSFSPSSPPLVEGAHRVGGASYVLRARASGVPAPALTLAWQRTMTLAQATAPGRLGLAVFDGELDDYGSLDARMASIRDLGATWLRTDFNLARVKTHATAAYDWTYFDARATAAHRAGLYVLGLMNPADWIGQDFTTSAKRLAFRDYVVDVVTRYRDRVRHWEVGHKLNAGRTCAPGDYAELLKLVYPAIKAADPGATVLCASPSAVPASSGTSYGARPWVAGVYDAGGGSYFDALGFQPYIPGTITVSGHEADSWHGWTIMASLVAEMDARGDTGKRVWATEFGTATAGTGGNVAPEATVRDKLIEAHTMAAAETRYGPLFVYGDRDLPPTGDENNSAGWFGLVNRDGTRKLAGDTFATRAAAAMPAPVTIEANAESRAWLTADDGNAHRVVLTATSDSGTASLTLPVPVIGAAGVLIGQGIPPVVSGEGTLTVQGAVGTLVLMRPDQVANPAKPTLAELLQGIEGGPTFAGLNGLIDYVPYEVRSLGIQTLPDPTVLAWATPPSLAKTTYTIGEPIVIDLGTLSPAGESAVITLLLGGVSKIGEITGTGPTRAWDTTGESAGAVQVTVEGTSSVGGAAQSITYDLTANLVAAPTVPVRISQQQWDLLPLTTVAGNQVEVDVKGFPDNGNSPITALKYSLNGAALALLPAATTGGAAGTVELGKRKLTVPANQTSTVALVAANGIGDSPLSFAKEVTPGKLDSTPPAMGAGDLGALVGTEQAATLTLTEASTVPWIAQPAADAAPSVAQVVAGLASNGAAALASGEFTVSASGDVVLTFPAGISIPAAMLYFAPIDLAGNRIVTPYRLDTDETFEINTVVGGGFTEAFTTNVNADANTVLNKPTTTTLTALTNDTKTYPGIGATTGRMRVVFAGGSSSIRIDRPCTDGGSSWQFKVGMAITHAHATQQPTGRISLTWRDAQKTVIGSEVVIRATGNFPTNVTDEPLADTIFTTTRPAGAAFAGLLFVHTATVDGSSVSYFLDHFEGHPI